MWRNPFDGARAKIARSHQHFKELAAAQATFGKVQSLAIELEPQDNGDIKAVAAIKALPSLAQCAIVADIVSGFRSSLDIAVSQACRARGQTDAKLLNKTYFAFGGSEQDWENNLGNRMAGADQVIRDVVRSFKPWRENGNAMLYALSKVCADDKHVDLVPMAARVGEMQIDGLTMKSPDGKGVGFRGALPVWGSHEKVEVFTILSPAEVEITGPCILEAKFGFGDTCHAVSGKPVIPVLNEMGAMCEQIVEAIEAASKL